MRTRDLLILAYDAFGGEIRGKTTLQKRIYFLGEALGYELGYEAHYYGPYSSEVANANAELKSLGYLDESISTWGNITPQGFEIIRYDYNLTGDGQSFAERKKKVHSEQWGRIREVAKTIQEAGEVNYMELSIAAKAYFILKRQGGSANLTTIEKIARRFGWSISSDELRKAVLFLERINFVSTQ